MKTEIKLRPIEIVKQVRLTANQRFALVELSNAGGRKRNLEWRVRFDLIHLGLIEERDQYTVAEKDAIKQDIAAMWKNAREISKTRDSNKLYEKAMAIRGKERELSMKAVWLTDAAKEYLIKGRVVITR